MNNLVFGIENVKKHRDIKLVTTEKRRNYVRRNKLLYSKVSFKLFIASKEEKTQILMNKPVYLGLLRL